MRGIPAICLTGTFTARICPEAGRAVFQKPILGGLDNHGVLIEGSLEEIRAETERIIRSMGKRGFMLGADCTVPASIDWARLRAAVEAAEQA